MEEIAALGSHFLSIGISPNNKIIEEDRAMVLTISPNTPPKRL